MTFRPGDRVLFAAPLAAPEGGWPATVLSTDPIVTDIFDYLLAVDDDPTWFGTGAYASELTALPGNTS